MDRAATTQTPPKTQRSFRTPSSQKVGSPSGTEGQPCRARRSLSRSPISPSRHRARSRYGRDGDAVMMPRRMGRVFPSRSKPPRPIPTDS